MHYKFHLSIPAGAFCAIYFGHSPIKGMMKYRSSDDSDRKKKSLTNMTWDLFIILQYFRKLIGNESKRNYLYASDDNAFKAILQLGIDVQIAQNVSPCVRLVVHPQYLYKLLHRGRSRVDQEVLVLSLIHI